MFHNGTMVFKWMLHKNDGFCRLSTTSVAMNDALSENQTALRLGINITRLHFKDNFDVTNFSGISKTPFDDTPMTPATGTNIPIAESPNTPLTANNFMSLLAAATSPQTQNQPAASATLTGGTQTQQTGTTINPTNRLADVRTQLKQGQQHDVHLTNKD